MEKWLGLSKPQDAAASAMLLLGLPHKNSAPCMTLYRRTYCMGDICRVRRKQRRHSRSLSAAAPAISDSVTLS